MAPLPPTIPTSFVPRQQSGATPAARRKKSGSNVFMLIGMVMLIGSMLAAAGIFGYEWYLKSDRERKQIALTQAQEAINLPTVEEFIRLKNRFATAQSLLDNHIFLSSFFEVLEERTLQTVTFDSLRISVSESRSAEIQMSGRAVSFNALAAQSALLATEKHIRRAIFSDITTDEQGLVRFALTATVEPQVIAGKQLEQVLPPMPDMPAPEEPVEPVVDDVPSDTATGTPAGTPPAAPETPTTPATGTQTPPPAGTTSPDSL